MKMTEGNPFWIMLRFMVPLMLGDLFQQLYIAVDSGIVGKFAGSDALGAVGCTTFIIRLVIGLFVGISAGAGVVIAQSIGAGCEKKAQDTIHTMAGLVLIGGFVLTIAGVCGARGILCIVGTPLDILESATDYLRIYFAGILFELIYNVGSGVLQAYGNTKTPFAILVAGSIANIILDILFVLVLETGVKGAALATVLSQLVTAVLVLIYLTNTNENYRFDPHRISLDKALVPEILRMGLPAGFQSVIVALSNVLVQFNVNQYGSAAVAGFGVFNKVDGVLFVYLSSISLASMTYTGQNYGAGKMDRVRMGIYSMVGLQMLGWCIGLIVCLIFNDRIFYLFTNDPLVVKKAVETMWVLVPGYFLLGISWSLTNVIRGMGYSFQASLISILNMCGMRQLWIILSNMLGLKFHGILWSYPISWFATLAVGLLYVLYLKRKMNCTQVNPVI